LGCGKDALLIEQDGDMVEVNSWKKEGRSGHPRLTRTKSDSNWNTTTANDAQMFAIISTRIIKRVKPKQQTLKHKTLPLRRKLPLQKKRDED